MSSPRPSMVIMPARNRRSRPRGLRAIAAVAGALLASGWPLMILAETILGAGWGFVVGWAATCAVFAVFLPRVSYRRIDWLFIAFVPFWDLLVGFRLGWRLANWPVRDWPPRPDEPGYSAWQASLSTVETRRAA